MGSNVFFIQGGGAHALQEARSPIESGFLQAICVHSGNVVPPPNTTWAEVGLQIGGNSLVNRVAILAAGYVAGIQVIGWTGRIILEPTMQVYLRIWSLTTDNFYVGILTSEA